MMWYFDTVYCVEPK